MRNGGWLLRLGAAALAAGLMFFCGADAAGLPARLARAARAWPALETRKPPPAHAPSGVAATVRVYMPAAGETVEMPLEEYVVGVLAAEMPAAFETEALKAQAVAARTRALRGGCTRAPGASVCADSAHCQGYMSRAQRQRHFGDAFELYEARLTDCALLTAGECVTVQGEPIQVLYHAASGGHTENSETVFSQALPYLRGVRSEWDADEAAQDVLIPWARAARLLTDALGCSVTEADVQSMCVCQRSTSGRPTHVRLSGRDIPAAAVRQALSLRSTWFSFTPESAGLLIQTRGYGHGVGMSQRGAQAMALAGADYRDILTYYYTGVAVTKPEMR